MVYPMGNNKGLWLVRARIDDVMPTATWHTHTTYTHTQRRTHTHTRAGFRVVRGVWCVYLAAAPVTTAMIFSMRSASGVSSFGRLVLWRLGESFRLTTVPLSSPTSRMCWKGLKARWVSLAFRTTCCSQIGSYLFSYKS